MRKITVTNVDGKLSIDKNPMMIEDNVFIYKTNYKTIAEFTANKEIYYSAVLNGSFEMPPEIKNRTIFSLRIISQNSKGERMFSEDIIIEQEG